MTALVTVVGAGACGAATTETDLAANDSELMAEPGRLWKNPSNIPVCWEPAAAGEKVFTTEKEWIRRALAETWTKANPRVRFTGFKTCEADEKGIRVRAASHPTVGPHTEDVGNKIDGMKDGMWLPLDLRDQIRAIPAFKSLFQPCFASKDAERTCIEAIAVHEFGHALGLRHEQDRSDVSSPCDAEQAYSSATSSLGARTVVIGAYDGESVMNYCKPNRIVAGTTLSEQDVRAFAKLYAPGPLAGEGVRNDPGRPVVALADETSFGTYAVMGLPTSIFVGYLGAGLKSAALPDPATALRVIDRQSTTLRGSAWEKVESGDAKVTQTLAAWTPPIGPKRTAEVRWNGRHATMLQLVTVDTGFVWPSESQRSRKVGEVLTAQAYVRLTPGKKLARLDIVVERLPSTPDAAPVAIPFSRECASKPYGVLCDITSEKPIAPCPDYPALIHVKATATADDGAVAKLDDYITVEAK